MSVSREATRAVVCTVAVEAWVDLHVAAPAAGAAGAALTRRQARTVVFGTKCISSTFAFLYMRHKLDTSQAMSPAPAQANTHKVDVGVLQSISPVCTTSLQSYHAWHWHLLVYS